MTGLPGVDTRLQQSMRNALDDLSRPASPAGVTAKLGKRGTYVRVVRHPDTRVRSLAVYRHAGAEPFSSPSTAGPCSPPFPPPVSVRPGASPHLPVPPARPGPRGGAPPPFGSGSGRARGGAGRARPRPYAASSAGVRASSAHRRGRRIAKAATAPASTRAAPTQMAGVRPCTNVCPLP